MSDTILTPIMTSNTAPSGVVDADGLGYDPVSIAYVLFRSEDGSPVDINNRSLGSSGASAKIPPHWVEYEFPSPVTVAKYQYAYGSYNATDFELQAFNGAAWVSLHSISGGPVWDGTTANQLSPKYTLTTTGAYTKYRFYVTDWDSPGVSGFEDLVGIAQLVLYGESPSIEAPPLNLSLSINQATAVLGDFCQAPALSLPLGLIAPTIKVGPVSLTVPPLSISMVLQPPRFTLVPKTTIGSSIVYRITLTGVNDLILPVSSLQMRLRSTGESFISVVVPDGDNYAGGITANADGDLVVERGIKFSDGSTQFVELARATIDDIRDDGGGKNRSITLSARSPLSWGPPISVELTGVTYRASSNSGRRYRADIDLNLRPGNTAVVGGESIVVDTITYIVSPKGETMEISEAV